MLKMFEHLFIAFSGVMADSGHYITVEAINKTESRSV